VADGLGLTNFQRLVVIVIFLLVVVIVLLVVIIVVRLVVIVVSLVVVIVIHEQVVLNTLSLLILCGFIVIGVNCGRRDDDDYHHKRDDDDHMLSVPANEQDVPQTFNYAQNTYDCFRWRRGSPIKLHEDSSNFKIIPLPFGYFQVVAQNDLFVDDDDHHKRDDDDHKKDDDDHKKDDDDHKKNDDDDHKPLKVGQAQAICHSMEGNDQAPVFCTEQYVLYCKKNVVGIISYQGKYPKVGDTTPFSMNVLGTSGIFADFPIGVIEGTQNKDKSAWDYVVKLRKHGDDDDHNHYYNH